MSSSSPGEDSGGEEGKRKANASTQVKAAKSISSSRASNNKRVPPVCKEFVNKGSCSYGNRCRYRHPPPTRQVCRHFLASNCRYGNQCKFLHPKKDEDDHVTVTPPTSGSNPNGETTRDESVTLLNTSSFPSISASLSVTTPTSSLTPPTRHSPNNPERVQERVQSERSGRRVEPITLDAFIKTSSHSNKISTSSVPGTRAPVPRPKRTADSSVPLLSLRDIEIEQLTKRYYDDQHQLVEKSPECTVYIIKFNPTDPEWAENKFPSFDVKISLPSDYPYKPCKIELVDNGTLSLDCIESVNKELEGRVQHHQLASSKSGQYELVLRPILHWLDSNAMRLISRTSFLEDLVKNEDEETDSCEDSEEDDEEEGTAMKYVSPAKRGTELRLVDIKLNEGVGTIQMSIIKVTVECSRCKCQTDLLCKENKTTCQVCSKCSQWVSVLFNPDLLHSSNHSLAYLDLLNCKVIDLVLSCCEGIISCVECGRDHPLKRWSFGPPLTTWCRYCHTSLVIGATQCKYVIHQSGEGIFDERAEGQRVSARKKKVPDFIEGRPLPNTGTCLHYKKSHRWLRFPCCGKVFPCDVCHDSTEDHPMERANRMICGYCSKEQVYSSSKACVSCSSDMTQTKSSSHWEGGQGCRNKVKMSKSDKQKYSSSDKKTVSMKNERVGVKGKNNVNQKSGTLH